MKCELVYSYRKERKTHGFAGWSAFWPPLKAGQKMRRKELDFDGFFDDGFAMLLTGGGKEARSLQRLDQ